MTATLTVLVARNGARQAKHIRRAPDGGFTVAPAERAYLYRFTSRPVHDLAHLFMILRFLERQPDRFIVYGERNPLARGDWLPRWLHPRDGKPATVLPLPRPYLFVDLDDIEAPGAGAVSIDQAHEILTGRLPPALRETDAVLQWTGSMGYRADRKLRARLIFWLSEARWPAQMKAWLAEYPADGCIYAVQQPIYTAAPVLGDGVPQRLGRRAFFIRGAYRAVDASELPSFDTLDHRPPQLPAATKAARAARGYEFFKAQVGIGGHFHDAIKGAAASYLRTTEAPDVDWLVADLAEAIRAKSGTRDDEYIAARLRDLPGLVRNLQRLEGARRASELREVQALEQAIGLRVVAP